MKISFLGPSGTFCEEALEIYKNTIEDATSKEFPTIYDALNAVEMGAVECAVIPIENSIEGSVNSTLDILAESKKLKVSGEIILEINQCLVAKEGTRSEDIELVLSHSQGLAQCSKYLRKRLAGIPTRVSLSTAEGAREVSNSNCKWAAISNKKTAELYGLSVIDDNIQDKNNNVTKFAVVSLKDSEPTGKDKTSIVFSAEDKPGSLYRILSIFDLWDINLTKIESRPAKNELGKYIFFVDFIGHHTEQNIKDALTMVNRKTSFFRLLGSYPTIKQV